jgi:hypothetical protein
MKNKSHNYNSYEKEEIEEEDSPVIENNSDFCNIKDLNSKSNNKSINNINKLEHNRVKPKKMNNFYKINTPTTKCCNSKMNLYSLILQSEESNSLDDKVKFNIFNNHNTKEQNPKIKKYVDITKKDKSKPVFTKISEDIYLKFKSKPNKEIRDINKMEEDAYNKMTSDQYILTCKNRENIKNKKILRNFLDRKLKEGTFKKIGIECDRSVDINKLQDFKRALTVTDRNNFKSARALDQFLKTTKNMPDKKSKNAKYKNMKIPQKGNILPQDSTFIFSDHEKGADLESNYSKNHDFKSLYDFLSEDEEEEFVNKTFEFENEIINSNMNFSLINEEKDVRDGKDKKNKVKSEKNKKESSSTTTSKKSNENNLAKKFLNIYKDILLNNFGQKMENDFDVNFPGFLLIVHKLGFTNKNFSILVNELGSELDKTEHLKEFSSFASNSDISINQLSKSNLSLSKTKNCINKLKNDTEFQLCLDAWKIITEKQIFDEDISLSSKKIFIFFISVLGLCKEEKNDKIIKKECAFFINDKRMMQQFNNSNKYIYKYFNVFRENAMKNISSDESKQDNYNMSISLNVSNNDSNYKNYNIYEKKYNNSNQNNKKKSNKNVLEGVNENSAKLFKDGLKEEDFFVIDKNKQSIISLSDSDNNSINYANNSMIDNSIFSDIKSILKDDNKNSLNDNDSKQNNTLNNENSDADSTLLKDNKNYFQYGRQERNRSYCSEIKSYIQNDEKNDDKTPKKIKYVFEIKIEDKPQKLILTKDVNKTNLINQFCKKFGINNEEKSKLIKVINEQLKSLEKINDNRKNKLK